MTDNASKPLDPKHVPTDQFTDTLNALVNASDGERKARDKATTVAGEHGPHAVAAIFGYGDSEFRVSVDGWCHLAAKAAGLAKSTRRDMKKAGQSALVNMADALAFIDKSLDAKDDDNETLLYPGVRSFIDAYMRYDRNGDMRRDYLIASRTMLPAEATMADLETVISAYDAIDDDDGKAERAEIYWRSYDAPNTFYGLRDAIVAYVEKCKPKADKAAKRFADFTAFITELSAEDIAKYQDAILAVMVVIEKASAKLETADGDEKRDGTNG